MLNRIIYILSLLTLGEGALAGPWLREQGTTFTAFSFSTTYQLETASQTYLEYGLSDETTLIADIGLAHLRNTPDGGFVTLSLRKALSSPKARSKWAYELGMGVGWVGDEVLPHVRTGISWGRGATIGTKSGWMTVEGAVNWDLTNALHVTKIDATLGINLTELTTGIIQLYTAHVAGHGIATIAPSIVITPKDSKLRIQIGSESQIGNFENSALKIALWREF